MYVTDVTIVRESVIYASSVKGIKYNKVRREMLGTDLMRVCCVFAD